MDNVFNPDVYLRAFKLVRAYVMNNSGRNQDVEDTLHEGLLVFFAQVKCNRYEHLGRCEYYILKICTRVWLKELRRRKQCRCMESSGERMGPSMENSMAGKVREELLHKIIERNISNLGPRCREVFLNRENGFSYHEIARSMGLQSDMIAKDKYFRCKKQLIDLVKKDPEYLALME